MHSFNVGTIEDVIAKAKAEGGLSMSTFSLKIISTDKVFYDGKCEYLVIPTIDGEKGILAHHENMVIALTESEIIRKLSHIFMVVLLLPQELLLNLLLHLLLPLPE